MPTRAIRIWNEATSTWENVGIEAPAGGLDEATASATFVLNALVNAKGDIVTATSDNTPAILTAGSNGQMLMADSSATAGLRYVDPPANRNLVMNGAMQVAQRGTNTTGITSGTFVTDRWNYGVGSFGTWTASVEQDGPTGSGLRSSPKLLCTTAQSTPAAGSSLVFRQFMEGQDVQRIRKGTTAAEQLTLSFWVKANVTGTYVAEIRDNDNTRFVSAAYTVSASATWEKKTITFPADTTGVLDNDNARSLDINFWLGSGTDFSSGTLGTTWHTTNANRAFGVTNLAAATDNYWQITGVQLETGPVATPFEFEPFEATLRKCQRYYWRMDSSATANFARFAIGSFVTTADALFVTSNPVEMRSAPSVSNGGTFSIREGDASRGTTGPGVVTDGTTTRFTALQSGSNTGATAGNAAIIRAENSSSTFIAFSAEL